MAVPATETKPALPTTADGDHDRFSHYAPKADVARAYAMGEPITALCGKRWVPSRDPERYPICPDCVRIKASLDAGGEETP